MKIRKVSCPVGGYGVPIDRASFPWLGPILPRRNCLGSRLARLIHPTISGRAKCLQSVTWHRGRRYNGKLSPGDAVLSRLELPPDVLIGTLSGGWKKRVALAQALRVRAGDEQAATELVRSYEPAIRRAARVRMTDVRLRRVLDSMDICQSVMASFFVRAASGLYDLETPEQLLRLLATMARNTIITAINPNYPLTVVTRPTPVQQKAFDLLGLAV